MESNGQQKFVILPNEFAVELEMQRNNLFVNPSGKTTVTVTARGFENKVARGRTWKFQIKMA